MTVTTSGTANTTALIANNTFDASSKNVPIPATHVLFPEFEPSWGRSLQHPLLNLQADDDSSDSKQGPPHTQVWLVQEISVSNPEKPTIAGEHSMGVLHWLIQGRNSNKKANNAKTNTFFGYISITDGRYTTAE